MRRILLDENIDPEFADSLHQYDVQTVKSMGWRGLKNGELLEKVRNEFDVMITLDRGILFQHNHTNYELCIYVLRTPDGKLDSLKRLLPKLIEQLQGFASGSQIEIELI